jgi:AhpD family alkylhydroperoxidase
MSGDWRKEFDEERDRLNRTVLSSDNIGIKRFFALDTQAYAASALDAMTKELMGLASSMVLRCDDCINYHIARCFEEGVTKEQFYEAFNVALIVGGSIVIPHLRRAAARMEELFGE